MQRYRNRGGTLLPAFAPWALAVWALAAWVLPAEPALAQKAQAEQGKSKASADSGKISVDDYDLEHKRDLAPQQLRHLEKKLKFDYEVAATNLWFFPMATVGSAGLGYAMILVPPDNWWKTIVHVYGWAGIGSAAVALGLSFYAIYDYNHSKARWQRFQELYGQPAQQPTGLRGHGAWRLARAKWALARPYEPRVLYSTLGVRVF